MKNTICAVLLLSCLAAVSSAAPDPESTLHFINGMMLERKGDYDAALKEYKRTMQLDPEAIFVYKQALNLALHVGKVDEAAQWADFVVQADSASSDNWVMYGNVKWAKGDFDGARSSFEKAAALDPSNHEAVYQLGSLWSGKDVGIAADYLKKYLVLRPEDAAEIYYQMAVLYNTKGSYDDMKDALLKSKEADDSFLQPRYMLASYYETKSDTAAALGEYSELLEMDKGNLELYDHVGELYAGPSVSNLDEAGKYFLKAWALDKADPTACFWLSVISEDRRDFAAAAGYLEGSRALKDDPAVVLRLAYYYTQSGRYEHAISMLEAARKKWPDNTEISYFLALGYDDTGKTVKAREMLKALILKAPDNTEARMQYAVISERLNDMPAAEENLRWLLAKDPRNANVLNYLGYALADRGLKLDEAGVLISSAVALEPENGAYLDSLAWVQYKGGRAAEAKASIKKAVGFICDDPVIWSHVGEIYEGAGNYQAAWLAWKNSRLLEKAGKRQAADGRIKALEKKIPAGEAEGLERAYLESVIPSGLEFSSFAKLEAKLHGKTIKLDAMIHFSPPSDLTLTVMGPLMMPLWKVSVSGDSLDLDAIALKGIDPEAFKYWASLMAVELRDWFAGKTIAGGRFSGGWASSCFEGDGREVCLDGDRTPGEIRLDREKKLLFRPSGYFFKNLYLFPRVMDFKLPAVSLRVTLDPGQMNFNSVNTLKIPD